MAPSLYAAEQWTEVKSPHFRVVTDSSAAKGREVANEFEQMRYVLQWRFPAFRLDPGIPLTIYAIRDTDSAKQLFPTVFKGHAAGLAGLFNPNWDGSVAMVLLDTFGDQNRDVVYHEYTHSVLQLNLHWLPLWLNEGIAEFFGYTRFTNQQIIVGAPSLRWKSLGYHAFSIAQILDTRVKDYSADMAATQTFYAESWALVHFMEFGPEMQQGKLLSEFVGKLEAGEEQKKSFS